jgi:hypothetical protein
MKSNQISLIGDQMAKFKETLDKRKKYVKNEFQAYGLDLAKELGDWKNKSLYLRLAKNTPREILEKARYFIKDQNLSTIETPYKLFMWKLKKLKEEAKEKEKLTNAT